MPVESGSTNGSNEHEDLLNSSLLRVTDGLPNRELRLMVSEADAVEKLLQQDIELLEKALDQNETLSATEMETVEVLLESEHSAVDQTNTNTVSALLGRMRHPLSMPLVLAGEITVDDETQRIELQKSLAALDTNPEYRRIHDDPTALLALWKKISTHKSAAVFRRPVNPKEAPGYADRIVFPIDLSMIRKMIVARIILSYSDLQERIGLICHNCLKYNGRESDYGHVTREFEAQADAFIVGAVAEAERKLAVVGIVENADGKSAATTAEG